jgi:protein-S-isoprenylcysteine O-methyltransferase Ste14
MVKAMIVGTSSKDESSVGTPRPLRLVLGTILHTLVLPGSLVGGLPYWLLESAEGAPAAAAPLQLVLGTLLIVSGAGILTVCFRDFVVSGKGTPNPLDPPRVLVSDRLYKYIRNPIYAAVVIMLLGEALVFAALVLALYAVMVWLVLHVLVLIYEEPTLRRGFGACYEAYCREVPRWIPRWPHGPSG